MVKCSQDRSHLSLVHEPSGIAVVHIAPADFVTCASESAGMKEPGKGRYLEWLDGVVDIDADCVEQPRCRNSEFKETCAKGLQPVLTACQTARAIVGMVSRDA